MSHGRKERTPAQLAVLTQAREKARIVIAERAKLNAQAKKEAETEPMSVEAPPNEDSDSESAEDEDPRLTRPKYRFVHGVGYIKIK